MSIQANFPNIAPTLNLSFALTKALDPRITFTRASTATYYGTRTAKAEENLLERSQEFDNAYWSKGNGAVTANSTTAPDGTTTADTFTPAVSGSTTHRVFRSITLAAGSTTVSLFVKANGYSKFGIRETSVAGYYATFDLVAVTVLDTTLATASITSVGSGWFRVTMTVTAVAGANIFSFFALDNAYTTGSPSTYTFIADGTSGLFLWGAQLEQRSAVTAYTPTTTQPITNYIPVLETAASGVARFDHNPTTFESLGLLIEEQRTNLLVRSEEFDNASWTKNNASITANTIVSPDGTVDGDLFAGDGATANHFLRQFEISAQVKTASIYAKKGNLNFLQIGFDTYLGYANFDLNAGTVATTSGGATASIQSVGNGWYRCSCTANTTSATTTRFGLISSGSAGRFESWSTSGSIFIWGAQIEAGAFPTSYIPTVASQVTRAADAASMTGANFSSWYRADEGTFYSESAGLAVSSGGNRVIMSASDGTTANRIDQLLTASTTYGAPRVMFFMSSNSTTQAQIAAASALSADGVFAKLASVYKTNDIVGVKDSVVVGTDTDAVVPVNLELKIGRRADNGQHLNGTIKKLAYYPVRVSNAELQALTS